MKTKNLLIALLGAGLTACFVSCDPISYVEVYDIVTSTLDTCPLEDTIWLKFSEKNPYYEGYSFWADSSSFYKEDTLQYRVQNYEEQRRICDDHNCRVGKIQAHECRLVTAFYTKGCGYFIGYVKDMSYASVDHAYRRFDSFLGDNDTISLYCNEELLATYTKENIDYTYKNIFDANQWQYKDSGGGSFEHQLLYAYIITKTDIDSLRILKKRMNLKQ